MTAALLRETERLKFLVAFRPELDLADARRPEGGDVPADLRRPAAAQHRHRRRGHASSAASATGSTTTSATTAPTSSSPCCAARCRARRSTSRAATSTSRARPSTRSPDPQPAALLRRRLARRRGRRRPPRRRLPHVGRAAGRWSRRASPGCASSPPSRAARCASASACTSSPATGRATRGPRPTASSTPLDPAVVAAAQAAMARSAVGRPAADGRRCTAAPRDDLVVAPNLWAGIGLVRGGAGTALVGSHDEVADRIEEYHAARLRRVHPLRPPAPRGGLLVRRGRDAELRRRGLLARATAPSRRGRLRPRPPRRDQRPLSTPTGTGGRSRAAASIRQRRSEPTRHCRPRTSLRE